jgi:hypothetical protein
VKKIRVKAPVHDIIVCMKMSPKNRPARSQLRSGTSLMELLLALAVLSAAMYPVVFIFRIGNPPKQTNHQEYTATLLAHHVIETIVARRAVNPSYLPAMSEPEPVVESAEHVEPVSQYFRNISANNDSITETNDSQLFWTLKPFKCQIDTYYLDGNLFKAIVYITYQREGRTMKVFFERLLPQKALDVNGEGEE